MDCRLYLRTIDVHKVYHLFTQDCLIQHTLVTFNTVLMHLIIPVVRTYSMYSELLFFSNVADFCAR